MDQQLSRRGWSDSARESLADDPELLAQGGSGGAFSVVYCRLAGERLALGKERPVLTTLLREHPQGLYIFANEDENAWHLVNAVYDPDTPAKPKFRRITLGKDERLRTASERIAMLDLGALDDDPSAISPLAIKERHDQAFSVEAVQNTFFKAFAATYEQLVDDIAEQDEFAESAPAIAQLLLDRLLFLYFVQRKHWLGSSPTFLYDAFAKVAKEDPEGEGYYSEFLLPLFEELATPDAQRSAPFLNGGLFEDPEMAAPGLQLWNSTFQRIFDELFERFNFTVTEDTPLDVEVAIDPEMLGRIFESLVLQLEASDGDDLRKLTGSYYTPREVVHWICRSSLESCIAPHLGADAERARALLELPPADQLDDGEFSELRNLVTDTEANALKEFIAELKVCDPAVGSGAFPVGMLQEIVAAMGKLDLLLSGKEAIEDRNYAYRQKRHAIENSLYGVDVQPQAVGLCELRLWLSLIVDYELDPDLEADKALSEVPALPNLGYRVKVADSLIERLLGEDVPQGRLEWHVVDDALLAELQEAKHEYFRAIDPSEKTKVQRRIVGLEADVAASLLEYRKRRVTAYQDSLLGEEGLSKKDQERREAQHRELAVIAELEANIEKARQSLAAGSVEPDDQELGPAQTFVWSLDFAEVFAEKGGFDVVIANPPYVRVHRISATEKKKLWAAFPSFKAKADLYACFIERGIQLARPEGTISYICSDTWQWLDSYDKLRELILADTTPERLLDLRFNVFAEAKVKVAVFNLRRRPEKTKAGSAKMQFAAIDSIDELDALDWKAIPLRYFENTYKNNFDTSWTPQRERLLKRIAAAGDPLGDVLQVKFGLKTGDDSKFLSHDGEKRASEPLLRGENVSRYSIAWAGEYVDYRPKAMRKHRGTARPGEPERFEGDKVLVRDTGAVLECALDTESHYAKDVLIVRDPSETIEPAYVAALLNSSVLRWFYQASFPTIHVQSEELRSLPIVEPGEDLTIAAQLADLATACQAADSPDEARESEIDDLVAKLYGLDDKDRKLILKELDA